MEVRSPLGIRGPQPADGFSPPWPMRWRVATHGMDSSACVRQGPWQGLFFSLGSDDAVGHFDRSAQGGIMTAEKNRQVLTSYGGIDMSAAKARQIVLAARPQGKPQLTDFRLEQTAIPTPSA